MEEKYLESFIHEETQLLTEEIPEVLKYHVSQAGVCQSTKFWHLIPTLGIRYQNLGSIYCPVLPPGKYLEYFPPKEGSTPVLSTAGKEYRSTVPRKQGCTLLTEGHGEYTCSSRHGTPVLRTPRLKVQGYFLPFGGKYSGSI